MQAHRGELACDKIAAAFAGRPAPAEAGRFGGESASCEGRGADCLAVAGAGGPGTVPVGGVASVAFGGESAFGAVFGVAGGVPGTGPAGGEAFAGDSAFCAGVSGLAGGPVGGEAFAAESSFCGVSGLTVGGTLAGPVGCEAFAGGSESCIGCDETGAAEGGEVLVMGGELVESAPAVLGALLAGGEAFGRSGEAGDALVVVGATTDVPTELRMLDVAGAAGCPGLAPGPGPTALPTGRASTPAFAFSRLALSFSNRSHSGPPRDSIAL